MKLVTIFKLLGEETRLRIVNLLFVRRICVCELQDVLGVSQVSASKHLARLRSAGIVTTKKEGQRVYYSLSPAVHQNEAMVMMFMNSRSESPYLEDLQQLKLNQQLDNNYSCPIEERP
jgi:ArsR family transcriptional regulator, arsenate/arsenite/antimonite-responsive transcriptional repressor